MSTCNIIMDLFTINYFYVKKLSFICVSLLIPLVSYIRVLQNITKIHKYIFFKLFYISENQSTKY